MTTTTAPVRGSAPVRPGLRRVAVPHAVAATVDGLALSTIVLHVTLDVGLGPGLVGTVLAGASVAALLLAVPFGTWADRVGLRAAAVSAGLLGAVALAGYAVVEDAAGYAVLAVCFAVAQACGGAARNGLAVAHLAPAQRLRARADMYVALNTGIGMGTLLGALAVATDHVRAAYLAGAVAAAGTALLLLRLPRAVRPATPSVTRGRLAAFRDRRFACATGLAACVQLTMPVLSVLLPVWVVRHTSGPAWSTAVALGLNTALVVLVQRTWTARLSTPARVARSARLAAVALLLACLLLAATSGAGPGAAVVGILGAVVLLTAGEVAGGAAVWSVALDRVPAALEGRYQAALATSASAARIVGAGVALPLVDHAGAVGWTVLGVVMAAACTGVASLAQAGGSLTSESASSSTLTSLKVSTFTFLAKRAGR